MPKPNEIAKIRRRILTEISKLALSGELLEKIDELPNIISTENGVRYRCCIYKERAILAQRINLALHQAIGTSLQKSAQAALSGQKAALPVVNVLPEACEQCPIDRMLVTEACRNCVAHHCISKCGRNAIRIVQNKAYIDNDKCVECGLCKEACPYGAIIELSRPCERACEVGAIRSGADRRAVIKSERCVSCGACVTACPFGAISDSSIAVQLITALRSNKTVYAVLAPSFVGQFDAQVTPGQIFDALKRFGFHDVWEASVGADVVVLEEAEEFVRSVPARQPVMTTSCCPAFVQLVEKHVPELGECVSSTDSPMIATARWIKSEDPEALVAFIGPCFAKKGEAEREGHAVDFVLTFEEVAAMLAGAGIAPATTKPETEQETMASHDGNAFARAGGVATAMGNTIRASYPTARASFVHCEGLDECLRELKAVRDGQPVATLLEGMACTGGCVGGPGTLRNPRVIGVLVEKYASTSADKHSFENDAAVAHVQGTTSSRHDHRLGRRFSKEKTPHNKRKIHEKI